MKILNFKIIILLFTLLSLCYCAIIGMDFGTQYIKTAYLGKKVSIVENEENKRKDPAIIGIDKYHHRMYGTKAEKMYIHQPERVFTHSIKLLGKSYNDSYIQNIKDRLQCQIQNIVPGVDRLASVYKFENETLNVDIITSMLIERQLEQVKRQFTPVTEGVFSISPSTTPTERQLLYHSARIAGIKPIAFVNSPLAFAVFYGFSQPLFENKTNMMTIDIGYTSSDIGVFEFGSKNNKTGTIKTKGYYTEEFLGGYDYDDVIANIFKKKISEKYPKLDISNKSYAHRIILQSSEKVKKILSVNKEAHTVIPLSSEIDFPVSITLEEFEKGCEKLNEKLIKVIEKAIKVSKLKKEEINVIQLVGGGMRVPSIQATLSKYFGEEKINKNVDADEGAAFGCIYYSVFNGMGRLSKNYEIKDYSPITYYLSSTALEKEIKLFSKKTNLGTVRTINFKPIQNITDFHFNITYSLPGSKKRYIYVNETTYPMKYNATIQDKEGFNITSVFKLNTYGFVDIVKTEIKIKENRMCTEKRMVVKPKKNTTNINITEILNNSTETNSTNETTTTTTTTETNSTNEETNNQQKQEEEIEITEEDLKDETTNEEEIKKEEEKTEDKVNEDKKDENKNEEEKTEDKKDENENEEDKKDEKKKEKEEPKIEWEDILVPCQKHSQRKLNASYFYNENVEYLYYVKKNTTSYIKYLKKNDEDFKRLGEKLNVYESTIYRLKEIFEEYKVDNEEYNKLLSDEQEWLDFIDLHEIKESEIDEKFDVLNKLIKSIVGEEEEEKVEEQSEDNNNKTEEIENEQQQGEEENKEETENENQEETKEENKDEQEQQEEEEVETDNEEKTEL